MRRSLTLISLLAAVGCSNKLETGYDPKPLDMPLSRQKTLYVDPYSEQAMQAQQDNDSGGGGGTEFHRPGSP